MLEGKECAGVEAGLMVLVLRALLYHGLSSGPGHHLGMDVWADP